MIKYNLLVALRNMSRNKIFSTINILGLAGSMAVFVLITSYVRLIAGTDKFHEHHPNIFRIERPKIHNMAAPIGPFLKQNYPEVEEYIRTYEIQGNGGLVKHNDKFIRLNSTWLADSSFFNVFTFPLIAGNPSSVLSSPDGIVLSEESAKRIFGDINPIGQSILWGNKHNLRVTGIMENMPANSSIQADAVIPIDFYKTMRNDSKALDNFYQWNYNTFLLLKTGVNVAEFEKKLQDELFEFLKKNIQIPESEKIEFILTNFPDIYFNTYNNNDDLTHGSRSNITIAIGVSIIILLLALINFTNLSTAQATYRTKEIGIRKTLGAEKTSIIKQHLTESILTAYLAMLFAVILVELLMPIFSNMVGISIRFDITHWFNLTILIAGPLAMGIFAGSYPAFYISSFSPKIILSGLGGSSVKGQTFRKILIATQFTAATVLIAFTLHVNKQVHYLNNKDLGIEKENKLFLESSSEMLAHKEAFMNDLWANPNIISASFHASPIGIINEGWSLTVNGTDMSYRVQLADSSYLKTLGVDIIAGRNIKNHKKSDSLYEAIINQRAIEKYGIEDPIGLEVNFLFNIKLKIVGVMSNFNYETLHKPIEPLMLVNNVNPTYITINYKPDKTKETIQFIETVWAKYSPNTPLTYNILADDLKKLYIEEARLKRLFQGFTVVAIFIACIGLFGLATFDIGKRIREIGIRKVLGSSTKGVVGYLVWKFAKLVTLCLALAFPISWWIINKWMLNFITPSGHSWLLYLVSGAIVIAIAIFTVLYHSVKAANTNPANVLKYE